MILNDGDIIELCEMGMITPFEREQVRKVGERKVISYGPSSYGYDIRISDEFKVYAPKPNSYGVIDPKNLNAELLYNCRAMRDDTTGDEYIVIPPHAYVLGRSVEYFHMPTNVTGVCWGKSTLARSALIVNVTPLEAGWCGELVIEVSNPSPLPVKLYANEGIAQVVFLQGDKYPLVTYADRAGKYQGQTGITLPKM